MVLILAAIMNSHNFHFGTQILVLEKRFNVISEYELSAFKLRDYS